MTEAGTSEAAPPPPPPMVWRPPAVFGTFREAVRLVRAHPKLLILPSAAVVLPVATLGQVVNCVLYLTAFADEPLPGLDPTKLDGGPLLTALLVSGILGLFVLLGFAATSVAAHGVKTGRPKALPESLDPGFTRMGSLLLLGFVNYLQAVLLGIGLIPIIYVMLRLSMAPLVVVNEGLKPGQALGSSWTLMRGNCFRLFGMLLVSALILGAIYFIASALLAVPLVLILPSTGRDAELLTTTVVTILSFILFIPMLVVVATSQTLFYLTIKARGV